jgi:hypothetical protein
VGDVSEERTQALRPVERLRPIHTHRAFGEGRLGLDEVKACLPGQSSSADASAIRRWARLLSEMEDYYGYIRTLGTFFRRQSKRSGEPLPDHELLLSCLPLDGTGA